jgi:hypothetical protein
LKRLERVRAWPRRGRIRTAWHDEKAPHKRLAGQNQAETEDQGGGRSIDPGGRIKPKPKRRRK